MGFYFIFKIKQHLIIFSLLLNLEKRTKALEKSMVCIDQQIVNKKKHHEYD